VAGSALACVARAGSDEWADAKPRLVPAPAPAGDDEPSGAEKNRFRVLLVEDDASMALLCRFNLELSGFEVTTAATGAEGLALARNGAYDVLLFDVMLPDIGGLELAARIEGTPVVFMSARGSTEDIDRGRAAGGIDYIVKPFDPVALPERLRGDLEELAKSGPEGVWRLRHGRTRM